MRKTLTALVAAASIAAMSIATPTPADARCFGCAVGLGILGGLIIGGAIAQSYPQYAPAPGYAVYPEYRVAGPVPCPGGYWARSQWVDQWGNPHWSRPRFFCPQY